MSELKVYKIDIAQGNIVEADQVAQLTTGMPQRHVKILLGTPLVVDPFSPERWDYIYNFQPGGEDRQQRQITLLFDEQGNLHQLEGDIIGQLRQTPLQVTRTNTTVQVPARAPVKKVGFWRKFFSYIPIIRNWAKEDTATPVAPVMAPTGIMATEPSSESPSPQSSALEEETLALPRDNQSIELEGISTEVLELESENIEAVVQPLQPGMSLSEINPATADEVEQSDQQPEELDDQSGLFDGLLRKVGE